MTTRNTPNYGWEVPEDDENIRDGAHAIAKLGDGVDASLKGVQNSIPSLSGYATQSWVNIALGGYATKATLNNVVADNSGRNGRIVRAGSTVANLSAFGTFAFTIPGMTVVSSIVGMSGDSAAYRGYFTIFSVSGGTVTMVAPTVGAGGSAGSAVRCNWIAVGG